MRFQCLTAYSAPPAQVAALRESLWLLFERRDQLAAMGARVPAGVLLHGPRGVGKATLVRALAAELDAELLSIGPAEVCGGGTRAPAP